MRGPLAGALGAGAAGVVLLASAAPPPAFAPRAPAAPAPAPSAQGCLIEPDRIAEIGSQVVGLVERVHADRGDPVRSGQPLVDLRAEVERANLGAADARSRIDAEVQAAQASLELAEQKVQRARTLVDEGFVATQSLDQARAEREVARQKLAQARGQAQVWREEREVAQAQLKLRTVRSPLSGIIVERYVNQGERVEERPLMRVAVVDPLRVELMVPTSQYGSFRKGDRVMVQPELPGATPMQATVAQIDRAMDAASNSFRVRLSLPNPGGALPSGLRCKAELPQRQADGAASATGPMRLPTAWRGPGSARPAGAYLPTALNVSAAAVDPPPRPTPPRSPRLQPLPLGAGAPLALRLDRSL